LYFVDILGELNLNEESLAEGDAARIRQEQELEFESITDTEVLMIDLP
jgi:redox-sensitive bicupin YhaK (pirin superfamily)